MITMKKRSHQIQLVVYFAAVVGILSWWAIFKSPLGRSFKEFIVVLNMPSLFVAYILGGRAIHDEYDTGSPSWEQQVAVIICFIIQWALVGFLIIKFIRDFILKRHDRDNDAAQPPKD